MGLSQLQQDDGSVLPVVAAMVALFVLLLVGSANLGAMLVQRTRSSIAADAAALAGATGGAEDAARLAFLNGAEMVDFELHRDRPDSKVVVVTVSLNGHKSSAAAERYVLS